MNKDFWLALLKRAAWTAAETALALIPVGVGVEEVSWLHVLSVTVMAALLSALKSIATGLPEVKKDGDDDGNSE